MQVGRARACGPVSNLARAPPVGHPVAGSLDAPVGSLDAHVGLVELPGCAWGDRKLLGIREAGVGVLVLGQTYAGSTPRLSCGEDACRASELADLGFLELPPGCAYFAKEGCCPVQQPCHFV